MRAEEATGRKKGEFGRGQREEWMRGERAVLKLREETGTGRLLREQRGGVGMGVLGGETVGKQWEGC